MPRALRLRGIVPIPPQQFHEQGSHWTNGKMEETTVIRVSVFYPDKEDAKFDHDYYAQQHMPLVRNRLSKFGLVRLEADKGVAGDAPHLSPPFICIGHLYFHSLADFHVAMDAEGEGLMADIPNYTNLTPQIQVSEIVGS